MKKPLIKYWSNMVESAKQEIENFNDFKEDRIIVETDKYIKQLEAQMYHQYVTLKSNAISIKA